MGDHGQHIIMYARTRTAHSGVYIYMFLEIRSHKSVEVVFLSRYFKNIFWLVLNDRSRRDVGL